MSYHFIEGLRDKSTARLFGMETFFFMLANMAR